MIKIHRIRSLINPHQLFIKCTVNFKKSHNSCFRYWAIMKTCLGNIKVQNRSRDFRLVIYTCLNVVGSAYIYLTEEREDLMRKMLPQTISVHPHPLPSIEDRLTCCHAGRLTFNLVNSQRLNHCLQCRCIYNTLYSYTDVSDSTSDPVVPTACVLI